MIKPLTHRIYLLGRALSVAADKTLGAGFNLNFTEFLVLLRAGPGALESQSDLAALVGVGEAGISRIIGRLVARGLIVTHPDPGNRRRMIPARTDAGTRLVEKASAVLESRFAKAAALRVSQSELEAFERVIDVFMAELRGI